MTTAVKEILNVALALPEEDRLALVSELLDSLPNELPNDEAEFVAELDRRSGDWDGAVPWEKVRTELRAL